MKQFMLHTAEFGVMVEFTLYRDHDEILCRVKRTSCGTVESDDVFTCRDAARQAYALREFGYFLNNVSVYDELMQWCF